MEITRVLDAALRKACAVWVAADGRQARLVWAVWRDGALFVATGGGEQQVPGLADGVPCRVTVRSPTTHSHLAEFAAAATRVEPDELTSAALTAARLNRAAEWTEVYRLEPAR
ncbi:hypothetical protein BC739_007239 [Kutzneria viridogrisea]|uniref:Uncharacterized protein n=1 Tax=Kutzneria viridogrisea TaxID=47990 RepID=A0ABR6BTQ8_9PSEU|nr:hypothetical protein [Kutzneria viridogrisea]